MDIITLHFSVIHSHYLILWFKGTASFDYDYVSDSDKK